MPCYKMHIRLIKRSTYSYMSITWILQRKTWNSKKLDGVNHLVLHVIQIIRILHRSYIRCLCIHKLNTIYRHGVILAPIQWCLIGLNVGLKSCLIHPFQFFSKNKLYTRRNNCNIGVINSNLTMFHPVLLYRYYHPPKVSNVYHVASLWKRAVVVSGWCLIWSF